MYSSPIIVQGSSFSPWSNSLSGPMSPRCQGFTITLRLTILGRIPLDE